MVHIEIKNLTVEFKVYGSNSRSMRNQIISQATGGRISRDADDAISVKALHNISMEIKDGDRVGLIGHNGAGKSTLLRVIAGIYKPSAGSVSIDGTIGTLIDPVAGIDLEATGLENIFLRGYLLGLSHEYLTKKTREIAEFTELGDFIGLPIKTYSAGMIARLAFAISMIVEPDILLIDEGLGAADEAFYEKMTRALSELTDRARILIHASHNRQYLESITDTLIKLERGTLEYL